MKFSDTLQLEGTRVLEDGNLLIEAACARSGCQDYLGDELGIGGAERVSVFRPEEVVFDATSMASFAGKPVTVGHPRDPVDGGNWKTHAVGEIQDKVVRSGDFVRVTFRVRDSEAIKTIQDGTREISMGYSTPVEMKDGVAPDGTPYQAVQTGPIEINHLAIVDRARGGSKLRIGDAGKDRAAWGASPIPLADTEEKIVPDNLQTVVLGDDAVQVSTIADASKINAYKQAMTKALSDAESNHKTEMETKDTEIGELKAKLKKAEDSILDQTAIDQKVADRASLVAVAKQLEPGVDAKGMSDADLRKSVVAAIHGDEMIKDASEAEIKGMFCILSKDAKRQADPLSDALKATPTGRATTAWGDFLPEEKGA